MSRNPLIAIALVSVALAGCSSGTAKIEDQERGASASSRGSHRAQVAQARAVAAKAKAVAEAELEIFPLVRFLGSPTQRKARAAQVRLEELIARPETGSTGRSATTKLQETHVAKARNVGRQGSQKSELPPRMTVAARTEPTQPTAVPKLLRAPLPPPRPAIKTPTVEAIVYDVETGIKTVHMSDGSIEESLFDPTELPASEASAVPGQPRISIVNRGPAPTDSDGDPARKAASNR